MPCSDIWHVTSVSKNYPYQPLKPILSSNIHPFKWSSVVFWIEINREHVFGYTTAFNSSFHYIFIFSVYWFRTDTVILGLLLVQSVSIQINYVQLSVGSRLFFSTSKGLNLHPHRMSCIGAFSKHFLFPSLLPYVMFICVLLYKTLHWHEGLAWTK